MTNVKKSILIVFVMLLIAFAAMFAFVASKTNILSKNHSASAREAKIGSADITLEFAQTPYELEHGLSDRPSLPEQSGLLFIFREPGLYNFWMKDMHFPLDIFWINSAHQVIAIDENVAPSTYPHTFAPPSPVLYVLEANAGFASTYNVAIGDSLQISGGWPN